MTEVPHPLAPPTPANLHLAPHLRELCSILADGVLRLRCRTAEELAADAARLGRDGEVSLHFTAHQSGGADDRNRRRNA